MVYFEAQKVLFNDVQFITSVVVFVCIFDVISKKPLSNPKGMSIYAFGFF